MGKIGLILACLLSGCGTYNAPDTLARRDDSTTDMARCGAGLGIDNKVGLIIKSEASTHGGELSAQQSSEIRAKVASEGLMTGDEKKYEAYLKCILEFDKRRNERKQSAWLQRAHQPSFKAYLDASTQPSGDSFARRLVIENIGEDLTELVVTPAPFLYLRQLCMAQPSSDCRDGSETRLSLRSSYIPIRNYYGGITHIGRYTGELYSVDEDAPSKLRDTVSNFTKAMQRENSIPITDFVITLVRLKYKDKFQDIHERYFDVSLEQKELTPELGQAIFETRAALMQRNLVVDARLTSLDGLRDVWNQTSRTTAELPTAWLKYDQRHAR